ncbi:hypothetical protein [Flaviflexus huanghaiensis]|uniref:hypothetical protein n=1 Tax=Flaviflexus huanghaiensis TaxID=1111473 RepID=UPI0015FCDF7B|nr:hypothetical protein [Flaviflexus huanghaiensis]
MRRSVAGAGGHDVWAKAPFADVEIHVADIMFNDTSVIYPFSAHRRVVRAGRR